MPDTAPLPGTSPLLAARPRVPTVRARHAASLVVLRHSTSGEPELLMGMRGARHRFMPNRLVFPGGAVDRLGHSSADPPLDPFGWERCHVRPLDVPVRAVDGLTPQQGLGEQDPLFEIGGPLCEVHPHRPELGAAPAKPGLDDERP